jgi:excisionase family DNA binding protein
MYAPAEYVTPAEAATELRVSLGTIYTLIHDGRVPGARVGSQWRISRRDLDTALKVTSQGPVAVIGGPEVEGP